MSDRALLALAAGPATARTAAAPTSAVTYNVTFQLTGADAANPRAAAQAIKGELDALLAVDARVEYSDSDWDDPESLLCRPEMG